MNGLPANVGAGVKRTVAGTSVPTMTNLPRASTQRTGSGKPDMAAAAAMASLVSLGDEDEAVPSCAFSDLIYELRSPDDTVHYEGGIWQALFERLSWSGNHEATPG